MGFFPPNIAKLQANHDVAGLAAGLEHSDFRIRERACDALAALGDVTGLATALQHKDSTIRSRACKALGALGDVAALPSLLSAVASDAELYVRVEAAVGIVALNQPETAKPLVDAYLLAHRRWWGPHFQLAGQPDPNFDVNERLLKGFGMITVEFLGRWDPDASLFLELVEEPHPICRNRHSRRDMNEGEDSMWETDEEVYHATVKAFCQSADWTCLMQARVGLVSLSREEGSYSDEALNAVLVSLQDPGRRDKCQISEIVRWFLASCTANDWVGVDIAADALCARLASGPSGFTEDELRSIATVEDLRMTFWVAVYDDDYQKEIGGEEVFRVHDLSKPREQARHELQRRGIALETTEGA